MATTKKKPAAKKSKKPAPPAAPVTVEDFEREIAVEEAKLAELRARRDEVAAARDQAIAKEKLEDALVTFDDTVNDELNKAVLGEHVAARLGLLALLEYTHWASQGWRPADPVRWAADGEKLIDAVIAGDHQTLLDNMAGNFKLDDLLQMVMSAPGAGGRIARILRAWGVPVPAEPKLEDFLPTRPLAAAETSPPPELVTTDDPQADELQDHDEAGHATSFLGSTIYTLDELGLAADKLKKTYTPTLPAPKGSVPARIPVVIGSNGKAYWHFGNCWTTSPDRSRVETAALRPLYSPDEWGDRPKALNEQELPDGGRNGGTLCVDRNKKRYVVGPANESIEVLMNGSLMAAAGTTDGASDDSNDGIDDDPSKTLKLLRQALHATSGAEERWAQRAAAGGDDDQVRKWLADEWHGGPGFCGGKDDEYSTRGGVDPAFWLSCVAKGKPHLRGVDLIATVRQLLKIGPGPIDSAPAMGGDAGEHDDPGQLLIPPAKPANQKLSWYQWAQGVAGVCQRRGKDVEQILPTPFSVGLYTQGLTPAEAAARWNPDGGEIDDAGTPPNTSGENEEAFADEPQILGMAEVGATLLQLTAADLSDSSPIAWKTPNRVRPVEFDRFRWIVLGTSMVRGVECWKLAQLAKSDKTDLVGEAAVEAIERGDWDGVRVIDTIDNKPMRICTGEGLPASVIYVRTSSEPAAVAGGVA